MHPETIAGQPDRLRLIVGAIRTYHDQAVFENEIRVFDMIRETCERRPRSTPRAPPRPSGCSGSGSASRRPCSAMNRCRSPATTTWSPRTSSSHQGRMWVIDWEYGGMTDPYFDLGDFCVEHPFAADEERFVLTAYCGGMDEHRFARMMLYKLVVDLWWSIWAMIQVQGLHARVRLPALRHGPHRALQQERRAPRLRELARASLTKPPVATPGVGLGQAT